MISMDTSSLLWTTWHEQLKTLLRGIHGHQKKTLAFFVLGIVLSGSAVMQRVAETANERIVVPLIWIRSRSICPARLVP
jgi:hypothetical protein